MCVCVLSIKPCQNSELRDGVFKDLMQCKLEVFDVQDFMWCDIQCDRVLNIASVKCTKIIRSTFVKSRIQHEIDISVFASLMC